MTLCPPLVISQAQMWQDGTRQSKQSNLYSVQQAANVLPS